MPDFDQIIQQFSYLGVFIWFLVFDQITPIPEEVVLVTLGYLSNHGLLNPIGAAVAALTGLVIIDNTYFYAATSGKRLFRRFHKNTNKGLVEKFKLRVQENAWQTLLIMAFFPKLRFLGPIVAASAGLTWKKFLLIDIVGAVAYVTFYMLLGIFFEHQLKIITDEIESLQHSLFAIIVGILTIALFWLARKLLKKIKP